MASITYERVCLKDFCPINTWEPQRKGPRYSAQNIPMLLIDKSTQRGYFNESKGCVRLKCIGLSLLTPFAHTIGMIVNVVYRILKLASFYHFWCKRKDLDIPIKRKESTITKIWNYFTGKQAPKEEKKSYHLKERLSEAGKDLFRIIASPVALIGLELSAIYGIANPYDGRKLFASIERGIYSGRFQTAPCFQPLSKTIAGKHLFGGDPLKRNTW